MANIHVCGVCECNASLSISAAFNNENEATEFFNYLNGKHPNIKFTRENNNNGLLPFLDIKICNVQSVTTSVFHKITYTGLLTNFKSFVPFAYKTRLVYKRTDRIYKINSSWKGFHEDIKSLSKNLLRNLYPKRLIDKIIKMYLDKNIIKNVPTLPEVDSEIRYFRLPYIGERSEAAK